ncbi:tRNA nucleotidyltransferase (CCA-adding enzyme) [Orbus hercynius]|uniref:CCA-adding enzyme n=1 Tax=Orbus hercynius TaxID=593135 RepID=A0A495RCK2_9GAMM|nr:multifunctional CCA addition/repair protein [Orbus hercynius]RKS85089.1 tRNA nucleotidyltransferase (CCA-adding enzyme) [Orbus hercynius]
MKVFLVGGAVRDQLLELPITEKDWVVVGETPQTLLKLGFSQVGKDFPVFLHPDTKDEYALARTERKSGQGYSGFICDFNDQITLEQDLLRRDLTVNAIAMDPCGNLIDPYGGIDDLNNRLLRHVSPAFQEDPLRVLRVARFAARFHHLGFTIALDTMALMKHIVSIGEINYLTAERVWQETEKALATQNPQVYFEVLKECGALAILVPELNDLFCIAQPTNRCLGTHTLRALKQSAKLTDNLTVRFAVLCHDFGNTVAQSKDWLHIDDFAEKSISLINTLCTRLKIPNQYKKLACLVCRYYNDVHYVTDIPAQKLIALFDGIDVWRNPIYLDHLILSSLADFKARKGFENKPYPQAEYLKQAYFVAKSVAVQDIINAGFKGQAIRLKLENLREKALIDWKSTNF